MLAPFVPASNKTFLKDKASHPATVTHPTINGDMKTFDVVIHSVFYRDEDGESRLSFRGEAKSGSWSGFKTFFVDECQEVIDGKSGFAVENLEEWVLGLDNEPTPIKLGKLIDAVSSFVANKKEIEIVGAQVLPDGDGFIVVLVLGPEHEWMYDKLFFRHELICSDDLNSVVTDEPIRISVFNGDDSEHSERIVGDGVTITKTSRCLPEIVFDCIPCSAGRIDIKF